MPGLLLTIPYTAVQFVTLQQCREFAVRRGLMTGTAWPCIQSGACHGVQT